MERKRIDKIVLDEERTIDCCCCWNSFDFENKKPIMICTEQHLLCEMCLNDVEKCPLCRVNIDKKRIRVSHEKVKMMKIEEVLLETKEKSIEKKRMNNCISPTRSGRKLQKLNIDY